MSSPITPQWANAPIDANGIFSRIWYLYFDSMTKAIAAVPPPTPAIPVSSATFQLEVLI